MACRIYMPAFTLGAFGKSIGKFKNLLHQIRQAGDQNIILDFSGCRMLNPFSIGGLANLIHHYTAKGYTFSFDYQGNHDARSYLKTVCFEAGCDIARLEATLAMLKYKTYIPIIKFPTGTSGEPETIRNQYLQGIGNLLKEQLQLSAAQSSPMK